jgi:cobalamin-dependent methionine synthase I
METAGNEVFQKEVLRYLGYRTGTADERIVSQIALVEKEAASEINAKNVFGIWDCQTEEDTVALGGIKIKSRSLACHLNGCVHVVLFAATLGTGADNLLRRYSAMDMEKALVAQAVCAAMIEHYCDTVVYEAALNQRLDGLYPVMRFSPGYGDFDISWQEDMLKLLNAKNRIALTLTDGYMLIPSKSVTAVVGFSKKKTDVIGKCVGCTDTQCGYRRVN